MPSTVASGGGTEQGRRLSSRLPSCGSKYSCKDAAATALSAV